MTSTFGRALLVEILFQFDSTVPKDSSLGRLFICTSSSLRMPKPITCVFRLSVRAIALGIATSKVAKLSWDRTNVSSRRTFVGYKADLQAPTSGGFRVDAGRDRRGSLLGDVGSGFSSGPDWVWLIMPRQNDPFPLLMLDFRIN